MASKGRQDKIKGKAKEMTGKVTGDRGMEVEGKLDQARGVAKKAGERLKDTARSAKRDHS
ncbi:MULTISPECIES: CsbD family protein [Streptomyces]|uniref:CsbD family protein n=1 Tax=Streptomyces dengpaensis TaxID=2049881 RepID=A0ABM6T030_9ACTN|nr:MULTISPECIES: CsbD family protein [Streptomyces]AVH60145.1 CsbD family protein [Streptomyces dengpaensis]PIB03395.1 CsbD family protein [Streptomyces sp. HG99]